MQSIISFVKKLIAFIFVIMALFCINGVKKDFNYLNLLGDVEKSVFVVKDSINQNESYKSVIFEPREFNKKRSQIEFEAVIIYLKNKDMNDFLTKLKVNGLTKCEKDGKEVLMGFSPYIDCFEVFDDKKYNLQILEEDNLVVGIPKILKFD